MKVITKEELMLNKDLYYSKILEGATLVYPTDTIYAFGCSALSEKAVKRVREAKERPEKPFSVIAPSKDWIRKNCVVDEKAEEWLDKLPGPYTLILKRKNIDCVAPSVNPLDDTLGIRMPDHWFMEVVAELGIPLITPSANVSGKNFMTSLDDMDSQIKQHADLMVDVGPLTGTPSTIVNLAAGEEKIIRRS
ncbi:threonylcarbamoyl-AMP synthase [Candidatus Woesearchaeota archaeon]|nr:MAG: threonylcarbamoyl-AMP synthase [Candidatus Woesearchaeota archaeon]